MNLNFGVSLFMCILWKIDLDFFLQIQPGCMSLDGLCFNFFLCIFLIFWGGSVCQIICRDYIAFRG